MSNPYYGKFFGTELENFREKTQKPNLNQTTIQHFNRIWIRNYLLNSQMESDVSFLDNSVLDLKNATIVFAGASPTLEDDLPILKQFRDRFFLLASDTSSYTLIASGILPDAILSIDSGRGTAYHFRSNSNIPVFTWLGGNREIFYRTMEKFIFFTTHPLDQIFQKFAYSDIPTFSNPSLNVAGMADSIRKFLGAKELLLTGVGFTQAKGKSHCQGTGYESYFLPRANRLSPLEQIANLSYKEKISSKNQLAYKKIFSSSGVSLLQSELLEKLPRQAFKFFNNTKFLAKKKLFLDQIKKPEILHLLEKELNIKASYIRRYL